MWNFIQATCLLILPVVIDLPTLSAPNQQFHCSSCNSLLSWLQIVFTQLGEMHSSKTKLVCEMLSKDTFLFPRCLIQKQRLMSPKGPNPSLLFFSPSSINDFFFQFIFRACKIQQCTCLFKFHTDQKNK